MTFNFSADMSILMSIILWVDAPFDIYKVFDWLIINQKMYTSSFLAQYKTNELNIQLRKVDTFEFVLWQKIIDT